MVKLVIFAPHNSARLQYVLQHVLPALLGIDVVSMSDTHQFIATTLPKVNYSANIIPNTFTILPSGLLEQRGVTNQHINIGQIQQTPVLFQSNSPQCSLGFDFFSAAFYMASRYEEYLPFTPDAHGRFTSKNSIAQQNNFLQKPIVHNWSQFFLLGLKRFYPHWQTPQMSFSVTHTFDVDIAWAYKNRSVVRTLGAMAKNILRLNFRKLLEQISTLLNLRNDPYFTFAYIEHLLEYRSNTKPVFFYLLSEGSTYDKNVYPYNNNYCDVIKKLDNKFESGIHPSYYATNQPIIQKEIGHLIQIIKRNITKSRQHYLRLSLPKTYQLLIQCGITDDYTMGYADALGFRAGMATPYHWYDLESETTTTLTIHPFQVMDVTLQQYLLLSPDAAIQNIQNIMDAVYQINGNFCYVWHNNSLSET
ncbi:MAG: polysaccharide deacetylase family protein, partial [Saprospiraceae bacterium]